MSQVIESGRQRRPGGRKNESPLVSIIVPVFNEEHGIKGLFHELRELTAGRLETFEFIFIDDGSSDNSLAILLGLRDEDNRVVVVELTRNFGQHKALMAGMRESGGDCVILMDADREDSVLHLPLLLEKWDEGYEVVYAIRGSRAAGASRSILIKCFHIINKKLSSEQIPASGTFGLMDRKVVDEIVKLPERSLYIPGIRHWVGYKQAGLRLDRDRRYDQRPRVSILQLVKLAFDSFASSSDRIFSIPLFFGIGLVLISLTLILGVVIVKFFTSLAPSGWSSIIALMLLLFGAQFAFLGLVGEFVARVLAEVRGRPSFIVRKIYR